MRESEKKELYADAIEVLVARHLARARPSSPSAYTRTVRADLTARLRDNARSLFNDLPELAGDPIAPERFADLLEPAPQPAVRPDPANPSAHLPVVTAGEWAPLTAQEKLAVRSRIASIRARLTEEAATRLTADDRPDATVYDFPKARP